MRRLVDVRGVFQAIELFADLLHADGAQVGGAALQAVGGAADRDQIPGFHTADHIGDPRRRVGQEQTHELADDVGLVFVFEEAEVLDRLGVDGW